MSEKWIQSILKAADANGLKRTARQYPESGGKFKVDSTEVLNFSSNDYLDLAHHPHVMNCSREALDTYGIGSGSSRLVTGTLPIHEAFEVRMAEHKNYPTSLLFGSGFMANVGIIPALVGRDDLIIADKFVHASMIDGCNLSKAKLVRFAHNDADALEKRLEQTKGHAGRKLILVESVYSMDGDIAPLKPIAQLAKAYDAMLMVDEAHAIGIFGPNGAGLVREHALEQEVNVSMGTLSKAFAGFGGYAACSNDMRERLVNSARAFIYTTAPPPAAVGSALGILDVLQASPNLGNILQANADYFRSLLKEGGLDTMQSQSQIIPVLVGDNRRAVEIANKLRKEGIIAAAIRPPTVPEGTARIRISITLAHLVDDLEYAAQKIIETVKSTP